MVAAAHSVLAQHLHPLGHLIGVGRHQACVSGRAQVLGGIKAERSRIAQPACFHAIPFRAPGLGGVFNHGSARALVQNQKNDQSTHWP